MMVEKARQCGSAAQQRKSASKHSSWKKKKSKMRQQLSLIL